jgi:hypothetical protein
VSTVDIVKVEFPSQEDNSPVPFGPQVGCRKRRIKRMMSPEDEKMCQIGVEVEASV